MQKFVEYVAPYDQKSHASAHWFLISVFCLPMLLTTDWSSMLYLRISGLLLVNIYVRLLWPSQYVPARAVSASLIAQPLVARLIAFAAEFGLYEAWALWCGFDFWSDPVWIIVLVGELTSTVGVLLQSEFIMNVEDTIWTTHAVYMLFQSSKILQYVVFGGFSAYMLFMHLPMRYARASTKIDLNWYFSAIK